MVVRVPGREGEPDQSLERRAVRHVVVALTALVLDDIALVLQRLLIERSEKRAHAVGLQPECEFQLVRGHGLEVVGPLEARRAVQRAASSLYELEVAVAVDLRRALEHEVLEEVGKPRPSLGLVARADVVPEADRGNGSEVVLGEHHAQPIGEPVLGRRQATGA